MEQQKPTANNKNSRDLGRERGEKPSLGTTSIRLTPASESAAEWISRVRGLSVNAAYGHALALFAEDTTWRGLSFKDVYSPIPGVWWCNLLLAGLANEKGDKLRAEFVASHKPFFFVKVGKKWEADEQKIGVLWGQIDHLADHWYRRKDIDAWATGEKMQDILRDAKVTPPNWGPTAERER